VTYVGAALITDNGNKVQREVLNIESIRKGWQGEVCLSPSNSWSSVREKTNIKTTGKTYNVNVHSIDKVNWTLRMY
jgi:hypothetical protein